jgi:hypothetical protein
LDALTEQVHVRFTLSFATASFIFFLVGLAWLYTGKKWLAVIMDDFFTSFTLSHGVERSLTLFCSIYQLPISVDHDFK